MTDLATLASELLPGTRLLGVGEPGSLRPITWVRVMRGRAPAFDALEPGDLVIAPASALAAVAPGPAELGELADALAAVPVSGVVLPEGAQDTATAIARAGVPVAVVGRMDPAALERSVVGYIVARGAELERQAALLEAELRRRALDGVGVAGLLGTVAGFLGRALALEGSRGDVIAIHVPAHVPGAAADAATYQVGSGSARRTRSESAVLRVPMPAAHGVAGAIVVLGAAPPSELAVVTLPRVCGLVALELAREEAVRGAADRARSAEAMPSAGPPWVVAIARQREPGAQADEPAAREAREAREQLRRALRLLAPARRMSLRGDADSIEVRAILAVDPPGGADPDGRIAATGLADLIGRVVALSRPFGSPSERPAAEAEARATLEAAERLAAPGNVVLAARLATYRMLGAVHHVSDGPRLARAVLEPLLASRPDVQREHLATLAAYLERGGVGEAATALGIHRNTATYRLRRIEALTGWDLTDPDLRLALLVALRVVHDH
ncbi:MAG TPA: helix-turn-helix domain-containing protein [Candidatus Limnocylindrales bacterium]|nr:helix-turn-helix domain-containing protein [Candidatus Limnocylindrales bacterium]